MNRLKFLLANALIVVVLYANGAIIVNYAVAQLSSWRVALPIGRHLYDAFILFAVYSQRATLNCDTEIYGVTAPSERWPEGELVKLDVADYFPFSPMAAQGRILVVRHQFMYGSDGQQAAWRALAAKIRERYNREHLSKPVEKIVLVQLYWPRHAGGPEIARINEEMMILYSE